MRIHPTFTEMKLLIVLVSVFIVSCASLWLVSKKIDYALAGRIAMAAMLMLTSFGHFKFAPGMEMMLPEFIPFKREVVYATGIFEILAAIGLLINPTYRLTGILLIVFFVLILPSNILASLKEINIEKGTLDGPGLGYLWFRIPLQLFFIGWIYRAAVAN